MTVTELIEVLKSLPEDLPVYVSAHYGQEWQELEEDDVEHRAEDQPYLPECVVISR